MALGLARHVCGGQVHREILGRSVTLLQLPQQSHIDHPTKDRSIQDADYVIDIETL